MRMNQIKKNWTHHWPIAVFWIIFALGMFLISLNVPMTADDFSYSVNRMTFEPLNGIESVIQSVLYEYQTWMGRLLCFFFAQLSYMTSHQWFFRLTFPFINCIIIYELYVLVSGRLKITKNDLPILIVTACLLYALDMKVLNQTLYWIIGYYTYFFPLVFLLIPVIYLSRILLKRENSFFEQHPIFLGAMGFTGSLFVEHYSVFVLVLAACTALYQVLKKEKINKSLYFVLAGCLFGTVLILGAPGIHNRLDRADSIMSMGLKEQLYFGYTRFIYTFFSLNQPLFLILSFVIFLRLMKMKKKMSVGLAVLLIPVFISSLILVFDFDIIYSTDTKYFLMFEWSYYHWDRVGLLKTSIIVLYTMAVFFSAIVYLSWNEKNPFGFLMYSASICLQAIFILTETACERTAFISSIIFIVLIVYYGVNTFSYGIMRIFSVMCGVILVSRIGSCCVNYAAQHRIFEKNDMILRSCALNKECYSVTIDEYNYDYVFKSEIDFSNQDNWVLRAIRTYYQLDSSVEIHSVNE